MANQRNWKPVEEDPPKKHVLLLSCMDQRLLDNTVQFMNRLNLQNRYDHVIFAGAAMGARRLFHSGPKPVCWKQVFFHQFEAAIDVLKRQIHDVFILEHLDCGAYKYLHPDQETKKQYKKASKYSANDELAHFHREEANEFAKDILAFCDAQRSSWTEKHLKKGKKKRKEANPWVDINVRVFVMDLIGRVKEYERC